MTRIVFYTHGIPVPQGSMRLMKGRILHAKTDALTHWRTSIAIAAKSACKKPFIGQPLRVQYLFCIPRPKTVRRRYPSVRPDLDKYIRAVNDALEQDAAIIDEDSRIVQIKATKMYAEDPDRAGVTIIIENLTQPQDRPKYKPKSLKEI